MDKKETIDIINGVIERWNAVEAITERICGLFDGGGDVTEVLYATMDALINNAEARIGDDLQHLTWFLYDNDAGKKGHNAKAGSWKTHRPIKTAKDLAALIIATRKD